MTLRNWITIIWVAKVRMTTRWQQGLISRITLLPSIGHMNCGNFDMIELPP